MIPKKVSIERNILINYCDVNAEELDDKESFEYISKDEIMNQIKEFQGISMGFSWEILQMLKESLKKL